MLGLTDAVLEEEILCMMESSSDWREILYCVQILWYTAWRLFEIGQVSPFTVESLY